MQSFSMQKWYIERQLGFKELNWNALGWEVLYNGGAHCRLEKAHATWYAYSKHCHAQDVSKVASVFHTPDNNARISQHATQINIWLLCTRVPSVDWLWLCRILDWLSSWVCNRSGKSKRRRIMTLLDERKWVYMINGVFFFKVSKICVPQNCALSSLFKSNP